MDALSVPGVAVDIEALLRLRALTGSGRPMRLSANAELPGTLTGRRQGRGLDIDGVRRWSPGDDLRHIDRNVTARTGEPHIRLFRDERERAVLLVADMRPSMLFGTRRAFRSVAAAEALTLCGWRAAALGCRIGLHVLSSAEPIHLPPAAGERAMPAVIGGLQRANDAALRRSGDADPPLADALAGFVRLIPRRGLVVLASAFNAPGDGLDDVLRMAGERAELRALVIIDAAETEMPRGRYPFVTLAGRHGVARLARRREGRAGGDWVARLGRLDIAAVAVDARSPPHSMLTTLEHGDGLA